MLPVESRPPLRVLIADDQEIARAGLRALLESGRITVMGEAATGREAVEQTQALLPEVVLMDVNMPDMDGLAATEEIKRTCGQVAVLVITGHDDLEYLRKAVAAGAAGYLLKGASRSSLLSALESVANGESIIPAHLLKGLLSEMGPSSTPGGQQPRMSGLSATELQVLRLLAEGLTNTEIAERLHYSTGTVKNAVQRIFEKLHVSDRTQAAVAAVRAGLLRD